MVALIARRFRISDVRKVTRITIPFLQFVVIQKRRDFPRQVPDILYLCVL
jgi:hypothetical protein